MESGEDRRNHARDPDEDRKRAKREHEKRPEKKARLTPAEERLLKPTVMTQFIACDRGCGHRWRPPPQTIFVGELLRRSGRREPFFSTTCPRCKATVIWCLPTFEAASLELLEHDMKSRRARC